MMTGMSLKNGDLLRVTGCADLQSQGRSCKGKDTILANDTMGSQANRILICLIRHDAALAT